MISLLMIVLLLFSGTAFAQDAAVFCGDLAEADCTLLAESQAAMMALDSSNANFEMNFLMDSIPDADGPITFSLSGSAAYTGGDAARELSASMSPDALSMEDMGAMFGLLADALAAIDLDLRLQLVLPSELIAEIGEEFPNPLNLELKLVDGLGYLNLDTLQALMGEAQMSGWMGLDVAGLLRMLGPQMAAMMESMGGMGDLSAMGMNPELLTMTQDPAWMSQFGTIVRTDDGSSDMATFEITIDLAAMYANPAMAQMLRDQIAAQMEMSGQEMSDEEIEQVMGMVTTMFEDMDITVIETIGVTDKYVHSTQVMFAMDMAQMMAAMGESGPAPKILFDMTITQDQFNGVAPITAPENAQVIPLESIGQMMGSAMPSQ
jgi:hypothetical protein